MRTLILAATILLALACGLTNAAADPFTGRSPLPAPAQTGTAFLLPGKAIRGLAHIQMQLNEKISGEFRSLHGSGSIAATFAVLALAFLYGVVHAAAPGHGKTVVGSYFVANDARWFTGLIVGGIIALLQGITAIVIVFVLSLVLHARELQVANRGALVDCVSYGIVAAMGVVLLWRAVTNRGCGHSHLPGGDGGHGSARHGQSSSRPVNRALIAGIGVAPCASAIIIMLFALANDAMGIGIAAVLALSLGMAVTVAAVGTLGVVARSVLLRLAKDSTRRWQGLERLIRLVGSTAIVGFAGLLMLGALSRL
jgi:nickel/cobalt exporter